MQEEGMGSLESEHPLTATFEGAWIGSQISGRTWRRMNRRPNFRPRVEAREIKDGGRLLGFYISEADEENRGVGFVNRQSTEKL